VFQTDFKAKIKGLTTHQAIYFILDLLNRISDENLMRLTYLGEKLTSDEEVLSGIAGVRRLLQDPRHPAKRLFQRVLNYLIGHGFWEGRNVSNSSLNMDSGLLLSLSFHRRSIATSDAKDATP